MALKLVIVRHGRVAHLKQRICYGWTDMELDEDGIGDARRAGSLLSGEQFDAAYASPLLRTRQTAEIILSQNQTEKKPSIHFMEGLKEYHFGCWEGVPYDTVKTDYELQWKQYIKGDKDFSIKDGEAIGGFLTRVWGSVDEICSRHEDGTVLIVSHFGCISTIIPHLLGYEGGLDWKFAVDPGGISTVEINGDYARLSKLNM
ncbi:histidine phosphatase family protein [Clostridia bacterium OttesenSCG-928-F22]|nr:histidine phosphatase family protein [Clostridia bacterium OttesenSCG-928-F22]